MQPAEGAPAIESAEWEQAFAACLTRWVEHLRSHGVDYDRHANYIIDEPGVAGGPNVEFHDRNARLFKSADPRIQIFANLAYGATTEHIETLFETTDIFDPSWRYPLLYEHLGPILERAETVWTYACGGGVRDLENMTYYWAPIWTGARVGITGVGFWSYAGRSVDFWQGTTPSGCDWELIYPGNGVIVPSRRWQGLRIGVEDYARLWMVQQAAEDARERSDATLKT